jgi:predicted aldo/keto reductase-like oxidoreductase
MFSCGGMRYQFKWQDVPLQDVPTEQQQNLEATIRRSLELGITHIETARGYGSSEMQLGQILPTFPREQLIVQTKVSPSESAKEFRTTFEQSLSYLNLDYVDLLGLHGINTATLLDWTIRPQGCLEVAKQLQAEGKVRFIGFSTHGATEVIQAAIATDQFDYVNLHWYYINQNNWPAILDATHHDMGVFIISPSDKGGMLYNPPQKLVDLCAPLSPMVFNDLFCLSHPQIHTLSIGAARPSDFDEHLKTLSYLDKVDEILPEILERLEMNAIAALGKDWFTTWKEGLPTFEQTPGQTNIPTILWLWNLATAFELVDYAKMRYNLLGNGGHWFPGKQVNLEQIAQLRQSLGRTPHAEKILTVLQDAHQRFAGGQQHRLSQQD